MRPAPSPHPQPALALGPRVAAHCMRPAARRAGPAITGGAPRNLPSRPIVVHNTPVHLPNTIILDLDDTILDDSSSVEPAWEEAITLADGIDPAVLLPLVHQCRDWYWSDPARHRQGRAGLRAASTVIVATALAKLDLRDEPLAKAVANRYRDLREAAIEPLPGAIETLQALRAMDIRLGLITNGTAGVQRAKVDRFSLAPYFDQVLIEGEFGAGKPEPRVYLHLAGALNTRPEDACIVGDNYEWEVRAPAALGFQTIWVDRAAKGLPLSATVNPNRTIRALPELLQ